MLEALGAVETVGSASDGSELAIERVVTSVAKAGLDVRGHAGVVSMADARDLLEGHESRAHGPGAPWARLLRGDLDLDLVEHVHERLFEEVGAVKRTAGSLDISELRAFPVGSSRWTPLALPARLLHHPRCGRIGERMHELSAHRVERVVSLALNVEAVEQELCVLGHP